MNQINKQQIDVQKSNQKMNQINKQQIFTFKEWIKHFTFQINYQQSNDVNEFTNVSNIRIDICKKTITFVSSISSVSNNVTNNVSKNISIRYVLIWSFLMKFNWSFAVFIISSIFFDWLSINDAFDI